MQFYENPPGKSHAVSTGQDGWREGHDKFNPLTPNDPYMGRTAPLTSKVAFYIFIQQI
jgi:hypothetical protein